MIKRITVYRLKEGVDPDEFWRYELEHQTQIWKKMPGLKKLVVSRAISEPEGDIKFWGVAESWWDDDNAFRQANSTPECQASNKEWLRQSEAIGSIMAEETEIEI